MTHPTRRILVVFAHPALQHSRVNTLLADAVSRLDGVTFHDLYEAYPDLDIDVRREQRLLTEHDVIVFQHPFFWYSTPSIVKEWLDLVLEHGWAYGHAGTALAGKLCLNAITTGGRESAYRAGGYNRFTIRQFLAPFEQTAKLCGFVYLPPFVVHGTHAMTRGEAERHASDYVRVVEALRDGRIDPDAVQDLERLNGDLDAVLSE
jgi:glutathione-regulated potassium-efflux system ancillary protein KefG